MKTIADLKEKGKRLLQSFIESKKGKDALTVLIILLVGGSGFFLGALSERENQSDAPFAIDSSLAPYKLAHAADTSPNQSLPSTASGSTKTDSKNTGGFVASKTGTKYYPPGCSTGRIKDANKVYFQTAADAAIAGYSLSATCK